MCWLLLVVFFWVLMVAWSYMVFYYEAANGSHLNTLRSRGAVSVLVLKGFIWSLLSHTVLLVAAAAALHRGFWNLPSGPANRTPVIFVHGLYHNHTAWYFYLRWFRKWGRRHLKAMNLKGKFSSINDYARKLAEEVDRVLEQTGSNQVDLVGHSMGGLVIRSYLNSGAARGRVRRVVTLATPHAGSKLAVFGPGAAAQEMVPGSPFLESLNRDGTPTRHEARVYSIYSIVDNMVLPNDSAKLAGEGVTCLETQAVNHLGLLFCKKTGRLVRACLDEQ
ncbi:MAG: esterase/lipase family protein [Syntrophobacteria bacterium]